MSIEEIKRRRSEVEVDEHGEPAGDFYCDTLATTEFISNSAKDIEFLLAENQRLAEEVERLKHELSGRNKLNESEWHVTVSGAKMIQSTYPNQSIGWIKIQRLIDKYAIGDRSDELKEVLNKVE